MCHSEVLYILKPAVLAHIWLLGGTAGLAAARAAASSAAILLYPSCLLLPAPTSQLVTGDLDLLAGEFHGSEHPQRVPLRSGKLRG